MHTNIVTSKAGQFRFGTTLEAITNKATAAPIFNICQNMKPAAAATGLTAPRVIPRAINAFGRIAAADPYNADHAEMERSANAQTRVTHAAPTNT